MLDEAEGDSWVYRREPSIRRPLAAIVRTNAAGLPFLAPEVQLLYKSKTPRERDEQDFVQICPMLAADARWWLQDALQLVTPGHPWISALRNA